jgi:small subunit ribosomal protein S20
MPITKSAHKALRQSKKRHTANKEKMTELKSVIKDFKKMVVAGKIKDAKKQLNIVFKKLDKAAKTNLIKKNKSSRLKSRLSKLLNKNTK